MVITQPAEAEVLDMSQAGRRYRLEASIRADPPAAPTKTPRQATIAAVVRISSHSREANFFGDVQAAFADFDLDQGAPPKKIWEEPVCHQNRGLPKLSILSFDGTLASDHGPQPVSSRIRNLGRLLPNDELVLVQKVEANTSADGDVRIQRARSKASGIAVTIRLTIEKCPLP